ncbi:MAG: hypothetical protein ACTHK3_03305 [Solirubrobacterales bacterium]
MTNQAQHLKSASPAEKDLLRRLALQRGVSFVPPSMSDRSSIAPRFNFRPEIFEVNSDPDPAV